MTGKREWRERGQPRAVLTRASEPRVKSAGDASFTTLNPYSLKAGAAVSFIFTRRPHQKYARHDE